MSKMEKMEIIRMVESSALSKAKTLDKFGISQSTYYRWIFKLKKNGIQGLADNKSRRVRTWNQLKPEEDQMIIEEDIILGSEKVYESR